MWVRVGWVGAGWVWVGDRVDVGGGQVEVGWV